MGEDVGEGLGDEVGLGEGEGLPVGLGDGLPVGVGLGLIDAVTSVMYPVISSMQPLSRIRHKMQDKSIYLFISPN